MQVVDRYSSFFSHVYCVFHPRFLVQNIQGYFEPVEGNFIMQVVDIRAFSVMFTARSIPDSWSRIYRGILSPLRGIL